MRDLKIILLLFVVLNSFQIQAQGLEERLNVYIKGELKKINIPDLTVLVVHQDSIVYHKKFAAQATDSSRYYIGSVSKSLTATGVLKLVSENKLRLDQNVNEIVPELHFVNNTAIVSIRHLLNHTSGIKKADGFRKLNVSSGETFNIELDSNPGGRFQYSNLNYSVLGVVIERVSGQKYSEYMKDQVFSPLDMVSTTGGIISPNKILEHYQYFGGAVPADQANYSESHIPSGFILSSGKDLANLLAMNINKGVYQGERFLDSSLVESMHASWDGSEFGYGMGWRNGNINGKRFLQHLGSTAVSYSGVFFFPDDGIGLVVLSNTNSLWFAEDLMLGILQIISGDNPSETSRFEFFFRYIVAILLLTIPIYTIRKTWQSVKKSQREDVPGMAKKIGSNFVLLILLIWLFPKIAEIPFSGFLLLQPDIGVLLILPSLCIILYSITLILFFLIKRNETIKT